MKRQITALLASVVILAALAWIWFSHRPVTPKANRAAVAGITRGLGEALAETTVQTLGGRGHIVLVTNESREGRDEVVAAFQRALQSQTGIVLLATEITRPDPHSFVVLGCPAPVFRDLLERHANADAFVFLVNLPAWSQVRSLLPAEVRPKLIAVDMVHQSPQTHYGGYFERGLLAALFTPNTTAPAVSNPKTPREWFEKNYRIITPQNYETLPPSGG